jgi:uncharacterized protein YhfF
MPPISELLAKLHAVGIAVPPGRLRIDAYGDSSDLSRDLIELIRTGAKRAGTGLLWAYEAELEDLPEVGDIEIVVDHEQEPALVTRVTRVEVVPFNEVTAEYATLEGEGDGSLDYWREVHWNFFSRECARIGREPREDMPVVCSVFELLASVPSSAA